MTAREPHPSVTPPKSDGETLEWVSAREEVHGSAKSQPTIFLQHFIISMSGFIGIAEMEL